MKTMSTISIRKNSPEGQLLCDAAETLGLDPASLLAGICINATRRRRKPAPQPSPAAEQPELPLTMPKQPQPKAAPSSGMFDIA